MTRREFLLGVGGLSLLGLSGRAAGGTGSAGGPVRLFLGGDVMTGRGIDQLMARSCDPSLHERYVTDARRYVELAEALHGRIPRPVADEYVWGDALEELERRGPDLRIVNLETAVTTSDDHWPGKGIHYRMHPGNAGCLTAAAIDCCVLANNHVLDWGHGGLQETLTTLHRAGMATAGAGGGRREASAPAVLEAAGRRVLLFAFGHRSSGIPDAWAAAAGRPGLDLLPDLADETARRVARRVNGHRRAGDLVVVSLHWGPNWGYHVPEPHRRFVRLLVDEAGVDVVHGHSSHHPLGIEIYRGRPILYGCGDLLNDYEGIGGKEEYRGDLALAYFVTLAPGAGDLTELAMVPFQSRRLSLRRPSGRDVAWLKSRLDRECAKLGSRVERLDDDSLTLRWRRSR